MMKRLVQILIVVALLVAGLKLVHEWNANQVVCSQGPTGQLTCHGYRTDTPEGRVAYKEAQ